MRPARVTKFCRHCGSPFSIPPCREWREHYCSPDCRKAYDASKAAELDRLCPVCQKPFRARRNVEIRTCSPQCAGILAVGRQQDDTWKQNRLESWIANGNAEKALKGPLNPRFNGRKIRSGYIYIWIDDDYIAEHTHVMQQHIGRKLTPDEVVHHKNRDRGDNRLENLELMTKRDHALEHTAERLAARKLVRAKKCKLHIDQVAVIRRKLANGATSKALAQEFGVTETTVSHIRNRVTWSHVA